MQTVQSAPNLGASLLSTPAVSRTIRTLLAFALLLAMILTLTPFQQVSQFSPGEADNGGDTFKQLGYGLLWIVAVAALVCLVPRNRLALLARPRWLVIFAVLAFSVAVDPFPVNALRGAALTGIGMMITACALLLPETETDFRRAMTATVLAVLAVCYGSVVVFPQYALHSGAEIAKQAGLWRGPFSHKNLAAPTIAAFVFYGIYCWRAGQKVTGAIIVLLAANFVWHTGSKTTIGFLPVCIAVVYLRRLVGSPRLVVAAYVAALAFVVTLTVGSVLNPSLKTVTNAIMEDPSFTGRTTIWTFSINHIPQRLWTGYGYAGFWQTPNASGEERDPTAAWDVRGIVNGHNNYLDAILDFGLPAMLVVIIVLFVLPARDYMIVCRRKTHTALADFFMMTVVLMALVSCLETFFFSRVVAIWILTFLGVFGLSTLTAAPAKRMPRD